MNGIKLSTKQQFYTEQKMLKTDCNILKNIIINKFILNVCLIHLKRQSLIFKIYIEPVLQ
ncbi:hypothetical protein C7G91_13980 [Acinetobacter nosocomialis]|nr:hypothetical protein C7G97_05990 [Acinetobacter nosocomialis]PSE83341.1 hypothetical protein C7G91_13980 [Acinetobacter nosocomialis]